MLATADEREEKRQALLEEGTQTRTGIYEQLIEGCGGMDAILLHRQEHSEQSAGGDPDYVEDGDPDYVADDGEEEDADEAAQEAQAAQSERLAKLQNDSDDEEPADQDDDSNEDEEEGTDDEYGGLE